MKNIVRYTGAGLIAASLVGLVGAGLSSAATAAPETSTSSAQASTTNDVHRAFYIQNTTKHTLELTDIVSGGDRDMFAPVGTKIAPGETYKYDKTWWVFKDRQTTLKFQWNDNGALYGMEVSLNIDMIGAAKIFPDDLNYGDVAATINGLGSQGGNSNTVTLSQKTATVINVPASDAQKQAEILGKTCLTRSARCWFNPTTREPGAPLEKVVAEGVNNMSTPATVSLTTRTLSTYTQSVEVGVTASSGIKDLFTVAMNSKYGSTWTTTNEDVQTINVTVPPGTFYQKVAVTKRERVTGRFLVTLGNTTWALDNVYFDIPLKDWPVQYKELSRPLTDQERAQLPKEAEVKPLS